MTASNTGVPEGKHTVTPHLTCANAIEAMGFYIKAFGAEEVFRLEGPHGKLMHGCIRIGDSHVMLVDEFPDWGQKGPKALGGSPVTIHLYVKDADAVFAQAIAAGAEVVHPLEDAFWGDRYGVLRDPYGHSWSVATPQRQLSPEEIREAAKKAFC